MRLRSRTESSVAWGRFGRKSVAPASSARMRRSSASLEVIMTTGMSAYAGNGTQIADKRNTVDLRHFVVDEHNIKLLVSRRRQCLQRIKEGCRLSGWLRPGL